MMWKRHIGWAVTGLALCSSAALANGNAPAVQGKAQIDARATIVLTEEERALILIEMRQFLSGVQAMTDALGKDDMKAAAQAARSLGRAAVQEVPASLRAKLPAEFKQLGFSVHNEFDQIAMDAESMGDMKHSMTQLADTLQKCVACHSIYQIQSEPFLPLRK